MKPEVAEIVAKAVGAGKQAKIGHCWFWFHPWEKWQVTEQGVIADIIMQTVKGSYFVQMRRCSRCGLIQSKRQETRQ